MTKLKENINFDDLSKEELESLHTEVHVLFNMVLSGTIKDWTFQKLYSLHKVIFNALIRAGGQHVAPIDQLDNIQMLEETATLKDLEYLNQKEKNIIAKVIAVSKTGTEFYYHCAVEGNTFIGKTFKSNILARAGEKLEVAFINLNQYTDEKTNKLWFNFYSPRVISKTNKQLTSLAEVKKLVQKTDGEIKVKEFPTISKEDLQEILSDDGKVYSRAELKIKNNPVKRKKQIDETSIKELKFKLKHNFSKNKFIIKDLAVENWSIEFKNKSWSLNKNLALEEKGIIGINQKSDKLGKVIDEGVCEIIEELENSIYVKFKGKELKGFWNFKKKISIAKTNPSVETRMKMSKANLGRKLSEETKRKISESNTGNKGLIEAGRKRIGEKSHFWRGGITSLSKRLRAKSMWKIWREAVFLRDNFTCQNPNCAFCNNKIGVFLHPHHIKPLAIYPELVFRVDNGITYCAEFHLKSGLHKNIKQQLLKVEKC